MENQKTRYEVLLAQLAYISYRATKIFNSTKNGNDGLIDRTTTDLYNVCLRVDDNGGCDTGFVRNKDGICVPIE